MKRQRHFRWIGISIEHHKPDRPGDDFKIKCDRRRRSGQYSLQIQQKILKISHEKSIKKKCLYPDVCSLIAGCKAVKNSSHKQRGATVGAAGGAVIGGILGNNVGKGNNTVLGAIIGAAIGGVAGGYIGNRMDKQAERIEEEIPGAEVTRVGEGINVTFNEDAGVYFDTNKSNVKGTSATTLDKLAEFLRNILNLISWSKAIPIVPALMTTT